MTIGERNRMVIASYGYTGNIQQSADEVGVSYEMCRRIVNEWKERGDEIFNRHSEYIQGQPEDMKGYYKCGASSMAQRAFEIATSYTDKINRMKSNIRVGDKVHFIRDGRETVGTVEKVENWIVVTSVETRGGVMKMCPMYKDIFKVNKTGGGMSEL